MSQFRSARRKLARAEQHYAALATEIRAFQAGEPVSAEWVEGKTKTAIRIRVHAEVPDAIATIFGDCLHNLRAALDHIVFTAADGAATNRTEWPMAAADGAQPKDWKVRVRKACPGSSPVALAVQDYVRRSQPWLRGTSQWMWVLHRLDVIDKHRLVLAANTNVTKIRTVQRVDGYQVSRNDPQATSFVPNVATLDVTYQPFPTGPLVDGEVLQALDHETLTRLDHMNLTFGVGLHEPNLPVGSRTLLEIASEFVEQVRKTIRNVESYASPGEPKSSIT